jgi:predicted Zn-dependent peptidase
MKRVILIALCLFGGFARSADIALPDYERVELENGTVLLLSEKHDVPLIGLQAVVKGGSVTDPQERAGMTQLLATLIQKGAGRRDAATFAEAAAGVGGLISARAGIESLSVSAEFLSRDVELMIELVSDMLMRPMLSEEEFEKERDRSISLIQAAKDGDPAALIGSYANAFIFGDHPYGNPAAGSESSLAAISHADLMQFFQDQFGGDRLIVAVAGDFDIEPMKARLTQVFGSWEPAAAALPEIEAPATSEGGRVLLIDKPGATQTYFWLGNIGVAIDYPRRAELNLANTVFGGRFTSMLVTALRVESGLTYSVRSAVTQHTQPGTVTIRSFTETTKTVEAIDMAINVLGRLRDDGLDDEILASARNYIMGQFPPTLETASALARMFAFLEQNGLGRTYVDDYGMALGVANSASVAGVIEEVYPSADELVLIMIGDAQAIRDDVAKYGQVTELSITEPQFRVQ